MDEQDQEPWGCCELVPPDRGLYWVKLPVLVPDHFSHPHGHHHHHRRPHQLDWSVQLEARFHLHQLRDFRLRFLQHKVWFTVYNCPFPNLKIEFLHFKNTISVQKTVKTRLIHNTEPFPADVENNSRCGVPSAALLHLALCFQQWTVQQRHDPDRLLHSRLDVNCLPHCVQQEEASVVLPILSRYYQGFYWTFNSHLLLQKLC